MEWRDSGVLLGTRRFGETSVIAEVMTRGHGRYRGLVRGGRSRRMQPLLQAGNLVDAVWRARLDEQLGAFSLEATDLKSAALFADPQALHGVNLLSTLLRLLPERDPHPNLFEASKLILAHIDDRAIGPVLMARLELALLAELGFGLALDRCAATGTGDDLAFVSPKSGRAVSRAAGEAWRDHLLPLPAFLTGASAAASPADVVCAFRITGHFLQRDVFSPRALASPDCRRAYLATLAPADT